MTPGMGVLRKRFLPGAIGLFAACLIAVGASAALAQGSKYRSLPWHLVDQYHRMPDGQTFQNIEIDMTLAGDTEMDPSMYFSPLWGQIDGNGFYFGLLSKVFDTRINKVVGKGAIFSRWGKGRDTDIRIPEGGWSYVGAKETSGEGDFLSVRIPFEWTAGTYTFLMKTRDELPTSEGTWVDLSIYVHHTAKLVDVGGLRFKPGPMKLARGLANFIEVFAPRGGGRHAYPKSLPILDVTFSKPRLNGTIDPLRTRYIVPKNVPLLFKTYLDGDTVTFKLGQVPVPTIKRAE